jgi:hypothetical protein
MCASLSIKWPFMVCVGGCQLQDRQSVQCHKRNFQPDINPEKNRHIYFFWPGISFGYVPKCVFSIQSRSRGNSGNFHSLLTVHELHLVWARSQTILAGWLAASSRYSWSFHILKACLSFSRHLWTVISLNTAFLLTTPVHFSSAVMITFCKL